MKEVLRSRNLWIMVTLWGGYWLVADLLPRPYLFDLMNSLLIAACLGVAIAYVPSVWRLWFRNDLDGPPLYVMAVVGFMAGTAARHGWNWVWRWLGKPEWMQDHIFTAWLIWVLFTTAVMQLLARDVIRGDVPKENWRWLGIVVAVGVALGLIAIIWVDPQGPLFAKAID